MDNPFKSPSVLSVCPGFLGLERGLQRAIGKIRVAAYVEIEAFIITNLIAGMEASMVDACPVWTDVKTFDAKPFRKKIHGIIGGYPCQPFSLAGKRKGHEDPRHLWPAICGIIKTAGPLWCLFENVSGHLSMGFDQVYKDLRALGYAVEAGIFTAEEVGAPHERERLFILAISTHYLQQRGEQFARWITEFTNTGAELGHTADINQWNDRNESRQSEIKIGGYGNCGSAAMEHANNIERGLSECQPGQRRSEQDNSIKIIGTSETELANANNRRCQQCIEGIQLLRGIGEGCESAMADTDNSGGVKNSQLSKIWTIGTKQPSEYSGIAGPGKDDQERKERHCDEGSKVEYTNNTRCREFSGPVAVQTKFTPVECNSAFNGNGKNPSFGGWGGCWPAGPGSTQYEWEEPRTIKPRMGSTINGYNFREDLLRAYGNSVVEQTADIAFVHLLKKHMKNIGQ